MSDSNRFGPISKTDQTAIAPVEDGATASKAYAIGSHFMRDGQYCTAIASIAQGASFTLNTNYTVGDVESRVKDIETDVTNLKNVVKLFYGFTGTKTITCGNYSGFILTGLVGGSGIVFLAISIANGNLTVKDLLTNQSYTNSYLTITYNKNTNKLQITATYSSTLTIIGYGLLS